jgi:hypothetical protein
VRCGKEIEVGGKPAEVFAQVGRTRMTYERDAIARLEPNLGRTA